MIRKTKLHAGQRTHQVDVQAQAIPPKTKPSRCKNQQEEWHKYM